MKSTVLIEYGNLGLGVAAVGVEVVVHGVRGDAATGVLVEINAKTK